MLCAIDPGERNCAYAIVNPATRELVDCGVRRIYQRHIDTDAAICEVVVGMMVELCSIHDIDTLLVEYQGMSRGLSVVESAFLSSAFACGIRVAETIHPISVKKHFSYLGCRGNRQNKIDAENLVRELGYGNHVSHIADCILFSLYWLDNMAK